jgi:small GTP-binding protein
MPHAADRIRNVALVGHRGSGKTSLHEALLFEAGTTTRLGSVADGTTVSDADEDEKARGMSISASLASFEWRDVKVNLIDTPGEPSFIADALGALRVCESAVFVVNGVMGVEVSTRRLWERAQELHVARLVFVNMLDRERADFFRTLDSLKEAFGAHVVATEIPIGSEHDVSGLIDLVDMKAYQYADGECTEIPIPDDLADQAQEYREKLMDEVAENSEALMERYLEGEDISHDEIDHAGDLVLGADRDLGGYDVRAERLLERVQRAVEVRALAVEHVHVDQAGHVQLLRALPQPAGGDLDPHHAVDHEHGGFAHPQRTQRVGDEGRLAGRVDQIDLDVTPLERGERRGDGHAAGLLVLVGIGDRRTVSHRAEPVDRPCLEHQGFVQGRLSAASVAH